MSSPETHSHTVPGGRGHWLTEKLWAAAAGLPVFRIAIADIPEFDQDCWLLGRAPSLRQVAAHAARIQSADLSYPIILSADGRLMDGGHRIARAWIEGHTEIDVVRFEVDPEPEFIRLAPRRVDRPAIRCHTDLPRYEAPDCPGVQAFTFLAPVSPGAGGTLVATGSHRLLNDQGELRSKEIKARLCALLPFARLMDPAHPGRPGGPAPSARRTAFSSRWWS